MQFSLLIYRQQGNSVTGQRYVRGNGEQSQYEIGFYTHWLQSSHRIDYLCHNNERFYDDYCLFRQWYTGCQSSNTILSTKSEFVSLLNFIILYFFLFIFSYFFLDCFIVFNFLLKMHIFSGFIIQPTRKKQITWDFWWLYSVELSHSFCYIYKWPSIVFSNKLNHLEKCPSRKYLCR